jgi:hypothetical protein
MKLGQVVMTRGIAGTIEKNNEFSLFIIESIRRYYKKDWGDIPEEDKRMNDLDDDRIVARYNSKHGDIYIITEWDRSYTTILFTNEY